MSEDEHVVTPAKADPKSNGSDSDALRQVEKILLAKVDDAVTASSASGSPTRPGSTWRCCARSSKPR